MNPSQKKLNQLLIDLNEEHLLTLPRRMIAKLLGETQSLIQENKDSGHEPESSPLKTLCARFPSLRVKMDSFLKSSLSLMERNQLTIAYLTTRYSVTTGTGSFQISPLSDNPELRKYCAAEGIKTWALITPMNPGSKTLPPVLNAERVLRLKNELKESGFVFLDSESELPEGTQAVVGEPESERGFFIQNIYPWEAVKIGHDYGKNAILVGRGDGQAELVWTDHESQVYFQAHGGL